MIVSAVPHSPKPGVSDGLDTAAYALTSAEEQATALDVLDGLVHIVPYLALLLVHRRLAYAFRWARHRVQPMVWY
jgi:hypothetical protein